MSDGTLPLIPTTEVLDRNNHRWKPFEIGMLLGRMAEGRTLDEIAPALNRTVDALSRQWARLVNGDVECPAEHQADLEQLRKRYKGARREPPATDQVTEQYKSLARKLDAMNEDILSDRLLSDLLVADYLRRGAMSASTLTLSGISADRAKRIQRLATDLSASDNVEQTKVPEEN